MFFQLRVIEKDQQSLRFLWRGPNRDHPSDVYQMQAMIFGAKSSPTSANYCLKRTAIDNQNTSSEENTSTVLRDFYMDDLLKSSPSEDETAQLALSLLSFCQGVAICTSSAISQKHSQPPWDLTAI